MKKLIILLCIAGVIVFLLTNALVAGGKYYEKAVSYHKKAQNHERWRDYVKAKEYYKKALRTAQMSLEYEDLMDDEKDGLSEIIKICGKKQFRMEEKEEYDKIVEIAYEHNMRAFAFAKADKFKDAKRSWERALESYRQALKIAPTDTEKMNIETDIINIERYIDEFTKK